MQMSHAVGKDEQGHIVMERADNPEHPVRLHTHEIAEDMTGEERGAAHEALQGVEVESAGKQGVGLARERTQQQHERKPRVRAVLKGMADATKEDPDRRGIIWAMHTHSADAVQEAVIAERGWKTATFEPAPGRKGGYVYKGGEVARIDGSTSGPEREAIKDAFNDPGSALRLIVATDAASTGLNMPGGSYSVHYDRGANGSVMPQRDGREYRPKQKADRVDVYQVGSTSAYTASEKLRAEKKTTRLDLADMVMSGDDSGTAEALANYLAPPS
jgi:superfamily II DNA/RNA helicase